jgi:hypothetical protein
MHYRSSTSKSELGNWLENMLDFEFATSPLSLNDCIVMPVA